MPTATSPYTQNDYQAASNYRPYELPVNDIFKAISAQNLFWEQGAQRVKSVYDNALNLSLTSDENKEVRRQFMTDADKQVARLSSMDLSDPSVQRQGFGIFKPIFSDDSIMKDDYLTRLQQSIISEADRYKKDDKTKGEGFHTDNLIYALRNFRGFNNKTGRGDIDDIFEKAKGSQYTPYHDVSKEYLDIASKCKPDSISKTDVQGLYFQSVSDDSQSAENLMGCIKSGLSDKAWEQLHITGTVKLGDNLQAVAKGYQEILNGNNKAYSSRVLEAIAEKENLKKNNKLTKEVEDSYNNEIGTLNAQITKNNLSSSKIGMNDFSDVKKDFDQIIGQVYANMDIGGFAQAFSYKKVAEDWKANAAGIAQMREVGENQRFSTRLQLEDEWKKRESDINLLKTLLGDGSKTPSTATYQMLKGIYERLGIPMDGALVAMDEGKKVEGVGDTYDTITNKAGQYHHDRVQSALGMYNSLKEIVGGDGLEALNREVLNPDGSLKTESVYDKVDKFLTDYSKGDKKLTKYSDQISNLQELANNYSNAKAKVWEFMKIKDDIDKRVDTDPILRQAKNELDMKAASLSSQYERGKQLIPITDREGHTKILTGHDIQLLMTGNHPDFMFSQSDDMSYGNNTNLVDRRTGRKVEFAKNSKDWSAVINQTEQYYKSGKQVYVTNTGLEPYRKVFLDRVKKLQPAMTSIVQDVVRNEPLYNAANLPGIQNSLKKEFSFLPEFANDDYTFRPGLTYKNANGDIVTEVNPIKKLKMKIGDVSQEEEVDVSDEVRKALKKTEYSVNSLMSNIQLDNGKLVVKTPYLPIPSDTYELNDVISNKVYAASRMNLAYRQTVSEELKKVPSTGFRIGFDIVGGKQEYSGQKNPNSFKIWIMSPDGGKEYFGQEMSVESQIGNQLMALEKMLPEISKAYYNKIK
jgi:hypothetical protein